MASTIRILLASCSVSVLTAQVTSKLVINQTESVATYTTAALSHHAGLNITAGAATWLNQPVMVEVFDGGSDTITWQYNAPSAGWAFALDMARHALVPGAGLHLSNGASYYIDTFALGFDGASTCTLTGFYSLGPNANGVPAWNLSLPSCTTDAEQDGMGAYIMLESSDDGSLVVFLAYVKDSPTANATCRVVAVNGQTGVVRFIYELKGLAISQGQVQVTPDAAFVMLLMEDNVNGGHAYIINSTGGLRGEVVTPFFIAAAISDDGNTLAIGDDGTVLLYSWSTSSMSYVPLGSPLSPPSGGSWIVWDLQFGSLMDFTPVAVVGYISGDVLDIRVVGFNVKTFAAVTDWTGPRNTDNLQNNPSIRCESIYCGLALWGDVDNSPTSVLLQLGSNTPLFTAITVGSMFGVDVVIDTTGGTPTMNAVYLATAGKATPANEFGNGGSFQVWKIMVPK